MRVGEPAPHPAQQLGQQRHRVAALLGHRGVRRLADRGDPRRVGALVADRDAHHGATVGELQPQPVALVQRVVRPDVGAVLEQPAHADVGRAVLLVGDGEQPQVTTRAEARAGQPGHRDHPGRELVLHVHGAPAVEVAVVDDRVEGRVGPVARVGRHHVEVPDEGQRGAAAGARDARDQVGPVRVAGHQLARRRRLPRGGPGAARPRPSRGRAGWSCRPGSAPGTGSGPRRAGHHRRRAWAASSSARSNSIRNFFRVEERHQQAVLLVPDEFTHGWCIAADDDAPGCQSASRSDQEATNG